jgi:hypothetical protein
MSLVRDERHDRMDKKNDHSRKHGQRDSFIDACAANHCYDFHIFPHPDDSASPDRIVTLRCFAERCVKVKHQLVARQLATRRASLRVRRFAAARRRADSVPF